MKLFKNYVILTQKELLEREKEHYEDGKDVGARSSRTRLESLEAGIERKEKAIQKAQAELAEAKETIEVHEEMRDNTRDIVKQDIENKDLKAVLEARQDTLDEREARIKDALQELESKEDAKYKNGYADGSADMARKIGEITQADRDNAMKIAMVSAASHTPTENIKELNNVHQLTSGTTNTQG